ncbi:hypothetical protein M1523_01495 [Patescibacteria group bacterium]|nr:hypothetical protein [Patescibacteria group bacterium]MCL5091545.1 hypothetical protein [Patescibacteria group bacterium]
MNQHNRYSGWGVIGLTGAIYLFTTAAATKPYSLHLLILVISLMISLVLFKKKQSNAIVFSFFAFILLVVGITGWFLSPFMYWLYLLTIFLTFLYSRLIATVFISLLILLFIPNVGPMDFSWDIMMMVSMFLIIPVSYLVRKEYLRLKESEKKILILEKEHGQLKDQVEELLANQITRLSARLREKIDDIRQIAYVARRKIRVSADKDRERKIITLSDELLKMVKEFEESATGKKLLKSR